jgi:hypothetical protein
MLAIFVFSLKKYNGCDGSRSNVESVSYIRIWTSFRKGDVIVVVAVVVVAFAAAPVTANVIMAIPMKVM